jgi:CRP-like cAMP-binding protein
MPADFSRIVRPGITRGLSTDQAQELATATIRARASAGDLVMNEGEKIDGLFLLMEGTVEILKQRPDGGVELINTVDGPTVLGEMSLLTDQPHSATVRAKTDCDFYLLTRPQFTRLLERDSTALYKLILTIAEVISRRLYRLDEKLLALLAGSDHQVGAEDTATLKASLKTDWTSDA